MSNKVAKKKQKTMHDLIQTYYMEDIIGYTNQYCERRLDGRLKHLSLFSYLKQNLR